MFPCRQVEAVSLRGAYAKWEDFCEVLERDSKALYLLAFLLTADHQKAEQCFLSTVDEADRETTVFKEWTRSWVKRSLLKTAIRIVAPVSAPEGGKRELWSATGAGGEIDAVTRLAPLERFVFVMSILERYSVWECSLLLGCRMQKVVLAQRRGLRRLPELGTFSPGADWSQSRGLEVTA